MHTRSALHVHARGFFQLFWLMSSGPARFLHVHEMHTCTMHFVRVCEVEMVERRTSSYKKRATVLSCTKCKCMHSRDKNAVINIVSVFCHQTKTRHAVHFVSCQEQAATRHASRTLRALIDALVDSIFYQK